MLTLSIAIIMFMIGTWIGWKVFPLYYQLTKSTGGKIYDEVMLSPIQKFMMRPVAALTCGGVCAYIGIAGAGMYQLYEEKMTSKVESQKQESAQKDFPRERSKADVPKEVAATQPSQKQDSSRTRDDRFPDLAIESAFRKFEKTKSPLVIRKVLFEDLNGDGEIEVIVDFDEKRSGVDKPFSCFVVLSKKAEGTWEPIVDFTYGDGVLEAIEKRELIVRLREQKAGGREESRLVKYAIRNGFVETVRTEEKAMAQKEPQEAIATPIPTPIPTPTPTPTPVTPGVTDQNKAYSSHEKTIDEQYKELSKKECERGLAGLLCREGLKMKLCDGKWTAEPPQGQSLCKRAQPS